MAENVTLGSFSTLQNSSIISTLNANNTLIENAFADCMSRAGTSPNAMQSNLDMNSNQIINLPAPASLNSPVRLGDLGGAPITFFPITPATLAQYWANVAGLALETDVLWSAGQLVTLTPSGTTITPTFGAGINFTVTLNAVGMTMANPTNPKVGQCGIIELIQDGTGSRTITSWGSSYKFPNGAKPSLSTAAASKDLLSYVVDASNSVLLTFQPNFG